MKKIRQISLQSNAIVSKEKSTTKQNLLDTFFLKWKDSTLLAFWPSSKVSQIDGHLVLVSINTN